MGLAYQTIHIVEYMGFGSKCRRSTERTAGLLCFQYTIYAGDGKVVRTLTSHYKAQVQIQTSMPYLSSVCCWLYPLLGVFFPWYSGFPLASKTNISTFQFNQEWQAKNHYVNLIPLNHYLFSHFSQCSLCLAIKLENKQVRLRANGCNIVGQQLPTLLDVTCCVRLHTVLYVGACCCAKFETGQTFSPVQTDATLLANNSQHCWELLRPFARSLTCKTKKY